MRQFTGAPGIFDGLNPVPDVCVRLVANSQARLFRIPSESGLISSAFWK